MIKDVTDAILCYGALVQSRKRPSGRMHDAQGGDVNWCDYDVHAGRDCHAGATPLASGEGIAMEAPA
eukprot:1471699-Pyramimonas_sp.AAC.1